MTAALAAGSPLLDLDVAVRDWCLDHRWEPLYALSRGINQLGSANLLAVVCLVAAVALGVRSRTATPVLPIVGAFALSHLLIGPIKLWTDRAAPRAPAADAVQLFADPDGWSYPSGHLVNAFIWYQVLAMLLDAWLRTAGRRAGLPDGARRALRLAPPLVISFTVTYLAFHWFTDVLAAVPLGLLLGRLLRRIPWPPPLAPPRSADE